MIDPSEAPTQPLRVPGPRVEPAPQDLSRPASVITVDVAGLTHRGKVRSDNQDHFFVARAGRYATTLATSLPAAEFPPRTEDAGYFMVVADGMGGHAAGELASRTAIVTLVRLAIEQPDWILKVSEESAQELHRRALRRYLELDATLLDQSEAEPALRGMGTTMTVACSIGLDLFISHVGDSRAYLHRGGAMRRLTRDHTYAQALIDAGVLEPGEAAAHRLHHVLTSVIGGGSKLAGVDLHRERLAHGDRLLLCTDGLTGAAGEEEISALMGRSPSAADACRALVDLALERGAPDNVTVVVARYEERSSQDL